MNKNDVFELCAYIAASAERLKNEPKDYGPLRLLEALSRLANLAATEYEDSFLKEIAAEVDVKRVFRKMADHVFSASCRILR